MRVSDSVLPRGAQRGLIDVRPTDLPLLLFCKYIYINSCPAWGPQGRLTERNVRRSFGGRSLQMCQHTVWPEDRLNRCGKVTGGHAIHSGGGYFVKRLGFYIYAFWWSDEVIYICSAAARPEISAAVQLTPEPPGGREPAP